MGGLGGLGEAELEGGAPSLDSLFEGDGHFFWVGGDGDGGVDEDGIGAELHGFCGVGWCADSGVDDDGDDGLGDDDGDLIAGGDAFVRSYG